MERGEKGFDFRPDRIETAWAGLMERQASGLPEFVGTSAPGMCSQSSDEGRHYWWRTTVETQAVQRCECEHCHKVLFD